MPKMQKMTASRPGYFKDEFCMRNGCTGIIQCDEEGVCYCITCGWESGDNDE